MIASSLCTLDNSNTRRWLDYSCCLVPSNRLIGHFRMQVVINLLKYELLNCLLHLTFFHVVLLKFIHVFAKIKNANIFHYRMTTYLCVWESYTVFPLLGVQFIYVNFIYVDWQYLIHELYVIIRKLYIIRIRGWNICGQNLWRIWHSHNTHK